MRKGSKFYCDNLEFTIVSSQDHTVALTGGECTSLFVEIPYEVTNEKGESYRVVAVNDDAVDVFSEAFSVKIPKSVEAIGHMAFSGSHALQDFVVDKRNKVYSSLDGVIYSKDKKLLYTFPLGKYEPHFKIPASVTSIGSWAFVHCAGIFFLDIPENVQEIGDMAFAFCNHLIEVHLPKSLKVMGNGPFTACKSLRRTVDEKNESFVVKDRQWLTEKDSVLLTQSLGVNDKCVKIPDGVKIVGAYSFAYNDDIEEVYLPKGLKMIDQAAFFHCSNLRMVHIPRSVELVSWGAFGDCPQLVTPRFPYLTQIAEDAFMETDMNGVCPDFSEN